MSQENVETIRRVHQAWEADDLEAFLAELHPDVEWHPSIEPALEGRATTYHGHEGVRRAWVEYRGEAFGRLTAQIEKSAILGIRSWCSAASPSQDGRPASNSTTRSA
jgi:ketosteroid isomerase-like protein